MSLSVENGFVPTDLAEHSALQGHLGLLMQSSG
jgi:hypothetical protein